VQAIDTAITQTVIACKSMSTSKTGALIVFERLNKLDNQINTGTIINSDTTAELLKNIFYNKAPLHDGAVIISEGKIAAAACMLPLSSNQNLSRDLGMRHRAGIGLSEHSDAVVAIVSEETGAISIAVDGMLKRHLSPETFEKILRNEIIIEEEFGSEKKKKSLADYFKVKKHG
ncbi:MAG: DNA integrity scanning protein DisA nucleotide-binding domain protein, partial [Oscillospiraceae bacterium]